MRKILEVLQSSTGELTFDTDIDVEMDPTAVMDVMSSAIFCMATKLWGGNEGSVTAMIRALFVADMAISSDRDIVMKGLMKEAAQMGKLFNDMMKALEEKGAAQRFGPGVARDGRPGLGVRRCGKKKMS